MNKRDTKIDKTILSLIANMVHRQLDDNVELIENKINELKTKFFMTAQIENAISMAMWELSIEVTDNAIDLCQEAVKEAERGENQTRTNHR